MHPETVITLFIASCVLFVLYLFPATVASARGHHNSGAILVANALLGWTGIGWAVCLVWAATRVER